MLQAKEATTTPSGGAPAALLGGDDLMAEMRGVTSTDLTPLAPAIDTDGVYPETVLRKYGELGAYGQHTSAFGPAGRPDLMGAIDAMAIAGEECLSTAFCMWCQDASVWYLEATENAALRHSLQGSLVTAAALGGTGLSNPMKNYSGIERLKLKGERVDGGYVVSGVLPWVSNLGPDHYFGAIFELGPASDHRVMGMFRCDMEGVSISQNAHFTALEGTRTVSVMFKKAFLPDAHVLADPADALVKKIKPGFILLQAGMAFGLIKGCTEIMRGADKTLEHVNMFLDQRPDDFDQALAGMRAEVAELAATPFESSPDFMLRVLKARLAASEWSLSAARAALLHAGARGYLSNAPAQRRLRESYFVAIVTPATKHLKKEIAALSS